MVLGEQEVSGDPLLLTVGASAATPLVDLVCGMCVEYRLTMRPLLYMCPFSVG